MENLDSSKSGSRDFDVFANARRLLQLPERFDPVITSLGTIIRDVDGKLVVWDNKYHTFIVFEAKSGIVYF
jgi:hypothetical protein